MKNLLMATTLISGNSLSFLNKQTANFNMIRNQCVGLHNATAAFQQRESSSLGIKFEGYGTQKYAIFFWQSLQVQTKPLPTITTHYIRANSIYVKL